MKIEKLVYSVNEVACKEFLNRYPKVESLMKSAVGKDIMKSYVKFLSTKEHNKSSLGAKGETIVSPTFGTKTFYHFEWGNVKGRWPEVFQYVYFK